MAIRAVAVATIILLIFALIGEDLLRTLGISLASFRIAGGLMLFLIALDMVFEKRTERRESRAQKIIDTPEVEDVSIFPMAMPMIAGPGSIAGVMLTMARSEGTTETLLDLATMGRVLVLLLAAIIAPGPKIRPL